MKKMIELMKKGNVILLFYLMVVNLLPSAVANIERVPKKSRVLLELDERTVGECDHNSAMSYSLSAYDATISVTSIGWTYFSSPSFPVGRYTYRVFLEIGHVYTFQTRNNGYADFDTRMVLYNPSGAYVDYDDDYEEDYSNFSTGSQIQYHPSVSGYYYLEVRGGCDELDWDACENPFYHCEGGHFTLAAKRETKDVCTNIVDYITPTTAVCGGFVSNGIAVVERGVCWGYDHEPTVTSDFYTVDNGSTGIFTSTMTGLIPDKTYYVRAYAKTNSGYIYGNEVVFSTSKVKNSIDRPTCSNVSSVTDIDGNNYGTVQLGGRCWMRQNLRTTRFSNGDPISYYLGEGPYPLYYYVFPGDNEAYVNTYGYLYNWYSGMHSEESSNAVPSGIHGICPSGWHRCRHFRRQNRRRRKDPYSPPRHRGK